MHGRKSTDVRLARGAAALAFALIGWISGEAQAQRVPTHVACVGDSITYGYLASSSSKSYPSDLQVIFGSSVKVMNFGRNSATMLSNGDLPYINQSEYTAATTFVSGAGASAVVDVIIMLGTNDSKSYNWNPTGTTRAQQFMTDAAAMVDHFTNLSTHPVVYLAIPAAIYTNTFGISESVTNNEIAPIIRQVATQKGMPIIDVHTPTAGHPEYFSDGVHPTDAGYMIVAQIMHDGLLASSGSGGAGGRGGAGGAGGAAGRGGSGGGGTGGAGGGAAGRGGTGGGAAGTTGTAGRGGSSGGATGGAGGGQGGSSGRGGGGGSATGGAAGAGTGGTSAGTGGTSASGTGGTSAGTSGTTGGTGAAAGAGGTSATGTGGTTSGSAGASAGGSGATGTGGSTPGDGGGCGCSVDADPRSGFTMALTLLLVIPWLRRRSRRS